LAWLGSTTAEAVRIYRFVFFAQSKNSLSPPPPSSTSLLSRFLILIGFITAA
jgi:hypothetical protein